MTNKRSGYSRVRVNVPDAQLRLIQKVIHYKNSGCKFYHNAQHLLLQLSPKERGFYDFLCEQMSVDSNRIMIDKNLKDQYVLFLLKVSGSKVKVSHDTINKAVVKLSKLGLIFLVTDKKAFYTVNPKFAYKGTQQARNLLLKKIVNYRIKNNMDINMLVDVPINDFINKPE